MAERGRKQKITCPSQKRWIEQSYKTVTYMEVGCSYRIRIQIGGIDREFTEEEQYAIERAREDIAEAILEGETGANPKTHKKARLSKLEILNCFGLNGLYVEEIPNGYCSRGCCAFYP